MQTFHINIHTRPLGLRRGEDYWLSCRAIPTLAVARSDNLPLDVTFDQACKSLAVLPRMLIEPDGSFVWAGAWNRLVDRTDDRSDSWQLEGVLYDQGDRLVYVELRGICSEMAFDQMIGALGWPDVPLMFQLTAAAVYIDEETFRQVVFSS